LGALLRNQARHLRAEAHTPFLAALSPDGGPELRMTIIWGAREDNAMSKDKVTVCVISLGPVPLA
jgi:hypothetical protein